MKFTHETITASLLLVIFCLWCLLLSRVGAFTAEIQNCPLYNRIQSTDAIASFNYTQDVMNNPELYWCDSIPNIFYKENDRVEGVVKSFNKYTAVLNVNNGLFCNYSNSNSIFYGQAINSFKLFSNETLVKKHLVPYLEGLLVEKNYTNVLRYYFYGFDTEVAMDDVNITLDMWINYFNYFLFCKEKNPYFYEFRQVSLPFIAQFSKYQKVQTLDVLFGTNIVQFCGKKELTFYNRTLLCLCTDDSSISNVSFTIRSIISDQCGGVMELFWVPAANHLSLKIIEIVFYFIQALVLPILCLFPIIFRSGIKWRDHIKSRATINTIEKGMKTPRPQEVSEKIKNTSSNNDQSVNQTKLDTPTENPNSQACTSNRSNKKETDRNSMKEQLSHELVRLICDLKLLAGVSLELAILCLLGSALQHAAEPKGSSVYPNPTLILASLAFLCVTNIPLAGLFVEVLLKLSGNNKKVSIHGL